MADAALTTAPAPERDQLPDLAVRRLAAAYDIGEWLTWSRTPKGSSNVSFFLTTSHGRYVLRRSNSRKRRSALDGETRLIDHLRAAGYPAPTIVRARSGAPYATDGQSFYLLTEYIAGEPYDASRPAHLERAATGFAHYHRLVRPVPDVAGPPRTPALAMLGGAGVRALALAEVTARSSLPIAERRSLSHVLAALMGHIVRVEAELETTERRLERLVVQGSYGRSALIFRGDELTGVVDYDRSTRDILGLDLAYTIKAFCRIQAPDSPEHRVGLDLDRCRRFLAAYRAVAPLAVAEIDALPLVFRAQRLLKVVNKCRNYRLKDVQVRQQEKDARKVAVMAEREAVRLQWLDENGARLRSALRDPGK
jgi:Ser/Thr protein kinase RdoA (MazF antagonist)